ncbi:MAG TPA: hypothetical protein VFV35_05955 [Acidimicrobiales bacterium]|nr:hypothetical protein [Acidimicrobiales bacterium]
MAVVRLLVVGVGAVVALLVLRVAVGALRARRRARRSDGVVSAWSRHPATRQTATVRVLRDPDELTSAASRAAAKEQEAARRISERAERIARLSQRVQRRSD